MPVWPHVEIVEGPACAGLVAGDKIVIEPWALVGVTYLMSGPKFTEPVLHVSQGRGWRNGGAIRFNGVEGRYEEVDTERAKTRTFHWLTAADMPWRALDGDALVITKGPWRLRLVEDGPPLGTVRRFGEHVACAPTDATGGQALGLPHTRWAWIKRNAIQYGLAAVDVVDVGAGELRVNEYATGRENGVSFDELIDVTAAAYGATRLDAERAKAIVSGVAAGADDVVGECFVGFDGVARARVPARGNSSGPADWFLWRLVHGVPPKGADEEKQARALWDATAAADNDDVAALVKQLEPERWQREQVLREEMALVEI